jgi:hypothetical protein
MLGHLGWVQFSNRASANTHKEFALENLMTMAPILDEGVPSLSFRFEGIQQVVPFEHIRELTWFPRGSSRESICAGRHVGWILEFDPWGSPPTKELCLVPIIQVFHSWMCKRILGRMRETKLTDMELNWLYSALIARQPIDPSYPMINRWCSEATSGSRDIGSGCYFSMLAISLRSGIPRNSEHLLLGTSLRFEYMKQGKYISGDERGGFKVAKVNLPLPDTRLRLFIQGKEEWLEEGFLVLTRKNKRERIVEEGSSSA